MFRSLVFVLFALLPLINCIKIEINQVTECEEKVDGDSVSIVLKDGPPRVDVDVDLQHKLTGEDTFTMNVHEYKNDEWHYNSKNANGEIKEYLDQFANGAWNKIIEKASPAIENKYEIQPDKYTWKDMELFSTDVTPPAGMEGRFKVDITIFAEDEPVFCIGVDTFIKP